MWTEIILLLVVALIGYLLFKLVKNLFALAINSVIGLFALFGVNYLFNTSIAVNVWSVLITAIGGIVGLIIVVLAHVFGLAF